jgi:hypothetical protein
MSQPIEERLTQLLLEAEGLERPMAQHKWELAEWNSQHGGQSPPDHFVDRDIELEAPFKAHLRALYLASVCLIDSRNLLAYLKQFYGHFGADFDSTKAASAFGSDDEAPHYFYNTFLRDLHLFLMPLGIDLSSDRYRQQAGVKYLENLLDGTAALLHQSNITPSSEAQVYSPVRQIVSILFSSARNPPAARFIQSFKCYKPDILIPELLAAVEYKYINSSEDLSSALAGIADDVKGYSGDADYKLFYAVFYLTQSFVGREQFLAAWAEKGFPKNWVPIYVVGAGR